MFLLNKNVASLNLIVGVFLVLAILASCKTTRSVIKEPIKEEGADYLLSKLKENELKFEWFAAKFNLDFVLDKKKTSFRGQVRMRKDSAIWVSFSPALGIEMARLLITNDSIFYLNRINKEYFKGDYNAVNQRFGTNLDYDVLQSILLGNDLTFYEEGKFRVSYDSKEYHLVTAGRSKLKKYVKTKEDATRVYIQNIFLDPQTFKITKMKIKEVAQDNNKLDAYYSEFENLDGQLFPHHLNFDITATSPVIVDIFYSRIDLASPQRLPFKVSSKYERIR